MHLDIDVLRACLKSVTFEQLTSSMRRVSHNMRKSVTLRPDRSEPHSEGSRAATRATAWPDLRTRWSGSSLSTLSCAERMQNLRGGARPTVCKNARKRWRRRAAGPCAPRRDCLRTTTLLAHIRTHIRIHINVHCYFHIRTFTTLMPMFVSASRAKTHAV